MGKIQIDHTGSGGGITLSSDGTDLLLDGSAVGGSAVGGSTGVDFNDNVKARFGTGNDLEIYHNGTYSVLNNSTGALMLQSDTSIELKNQANSENYLVATANGAVQIFYDNAEKLATTSTGIDVTGVITDDGATHDGDVTFTGASYNAVWDKSDNALEFADNAKAIFGAGSDLQIYHNGSNNIISTTANNSNLQFRPHGTGALEIYGDDPKLVFNDVTGGIQYDFSIRGNQGAFTIRDETNSEDILKYTGNGAAELYHNGSKKFETTSSGIQTTGTVNVNGAYTLPTSDGSANQVLTTDGSGAVTFADAGGASAYTIDNKTAAYTVVAGDLGKIINCSSGTFTITLTAAATLGAGFEVTIWNTSTTTGHSITIDPNSSETIDGKSTIVLRRGEGVQVVCDGSNWQTGYKKAMRGYAENLNSDNNRPIASGDRAISIGYDSQATGVDSVSFGSGARAQSTASTAIGDNSGQNGSITTSGSGAMALGGSYASGTDSFAAAIANNTSSYGSTGANSIAMGYQAKASVQGAVAIGYTAVAENNTHAVAIGRSYADGADSFAAAIGNSASSLGAKGDQSVAIGYYATANGGNHSLALGGNTSVTASYATAINGGNTGNEATQQGAFAFGRGAKAAIVGKFAFANDRFSSNGDAQGGMYILRADTTDATATVLTTDNSTAGSTDQIVAASDTCITFDGTITAMQNGAQAYASWRIEGLLVNDGGTTTLANSATTVIDNQSDWVMALSADNTNNALAITCTGEASHNIRWVANIRTTEVTYA